MTFDVKFLIRPHLKNFKAYSSARSEYTGHEAVFLDANENPIGSASGNAVNRYPDPLQTKVKQGISKIKNISPAQIFIGNGSDEAIDLLYRAFCEPKTDNVITCPPTYGMYETCAHLNDIELREVLLSEDFQLRVDEILAQVDRHTKMIFVCSPNNPTGNILKRQDILKLLSNFQGLVVVDEAYIDFSNEPSWIGKIADCPNLVVMQTFSKAWGMAGIRMGTAYASAEIISLLSAIKPPYNVNALTQNEALKALSCSELKDQMVHEIIEQRAILLKEIASLKYVQKIYPTDSNFALIKVDDANKLYHFLTSHQVIVRNRTSTPLCHNCVRITIGTATENTELMHWMNEFSEMQ